MNKIPTLFQRDLADMAVVTREVNPACQWVVDGEGVATRKYDGTCVMYDGCHWWARREVKPGKKAPTGFVEVTFDRVTSKSMGWEPMEQSAFVKFHGEALLVGHPIHGLPEGTYELVGPKINGNPERIGQHELWSHAEATVYEDAPRDFDGLVRWLMGFEGEGIVWHHPDGRMAKLKRRDFRL